jgi:haloalkane dehalogenase
MKLLRTPIHSFKNLPDFQFEPRYLEIDEIRIHYIEEGPHNAEVILLMHGESWC